MTKTLNLTDVDRKNARVTYNVNRFEVYHADGYMLTAAVDKVDLKAQLAANGFDPATTVLDAAAMRKYMAA
jgi:hypothetical protein